MGQRQSCGAASSERESVVFRLGEASFRMDMEQVLQVVRTRGVTPCAREGTCVCGLVNVKGRTVPVLDMCELLQRGHHTKETPKSRIIVAEGEYGTVAFVVDAVTNVVSRTDSGGGTDAPLVDIDAALARRHLV